jgi:hypothetical protein
MSERDEQHATTLDRIIEKYTATPRNDPERINQYVVSVRKERRGSRPERRRSGSCRSRG